MDTISPCPQDGNPSKQCTGPCGRILPATSEYFYRKKTGKYGFQPECKLCRSARMKEYNEQPKIKENKKAWSKKYWEKPEVRERQRELREASKPPKDIIPEGHKRCYICKNVFLVTSENFYPSKYTKSGFRHECKECSNAKVKEYYQLPDAKERRKAYNAARRNKPEFRERERVRYRAYRNQPEVQKRYRALQKARYYRMRERILGQQKVRNSRPDVRAKRQAYLPAWQKAYYSRPEIKESKRAHVRNRYARKINATGTHTPQQIQEQYDRQKGKCYYCQKKVTWGKHHVDHVVPLSRGGSNDISNLVITCPTCNLSKNDKMPHEWPDGGRLL